MKITAVAITNILQFLAQTPQRLHRVSHILDNSQLQHKPDKKSWSASEVLAHLRACADVWGNTIEAMLTQDTPTLKHVSPRTYMRKTDYLQQNFHESLAAFTQQRSQLLARLEGGETADWSRAAIIKERQHTVFSQARRMALHEITHCEQLEHRVDRLK